MDPTDHGNLGQTDNPTNEVETLLNRAERARQWAVEQQRGQAVHAGPEEHLHLEGRFLADHTPRQVSQLIARTLTGLHHQPHAGRPR